MYLDEENMLTVSAKLRCSVCKYGHYDYGNLQLYCDMGNIYVDLLKEACEDFTLSDKIRENYKPYYEREDS